MNIDDKRSLSFVRLQNAKECLSDAKNLLENNSFKGAANRSYYAVYHAIRAVLAMDGIDMKHHSGTINEFRRLYIKTGILNPSLSKTIDELFDIRTSADYDDFYVVGKEDVAEQVKNAESFVTEIETYLDELFKNE